MGNSGRVLVVDDDVDTADLLGEVLCGLGVAIRVAYTGASAVEIAAEFVPTVVLLDLGLPDLDGYEVARRLRAIPALADVKIVALSGRREDVARSLTAGLHAHFLKPIAITALVSQLA